MFKILSVSTVKTGLRSQKLLERLQHDSALKKQKDFQIIKKISTLTAFKKSKNILFYLPIHGEVDLEPLFQKYHSKKDFCLPRVKGKNLTIHFIDDLAHTEKGSFQINEPKTSLKKINPKEINIALIPGVVFSNNGHRIGYGKGFYDRFLKKTTCLKIGIAYDFQIVKNIEGQLHDIPMDLILSEKRKILVGKDHKQSQAAKPKN